MSVTFVIGRSGSGKTFRCFSRIVDALRGDPLGPAIYWLLPRQATFEAERRLTCDSQLAGFCRARVLGFATLGKEILGHTGGSEIPEVSSIGRQMILGHLLRQHAPELEFFKSVERKAGLAAELDATFDEFERAGKTTADLSAILDEISMSAPVDIEILTLMAKLKDVRLLYDAYNAFLGQDRIDPYRRLQQTLEAVKSSAALNGATIYVDGFLEFTEHERQMLGALATAGAALEISLVMDPDSAILRDPHQFPPDMSLFHRTEMTYRRLWFTFTEQNVPVNEPVMLRENHRTKSPMLARLEREMFSPASIRHQTKVAPAQVANVSDVDCGNRAGKLAEPIAIERIEAPDRAAEVDAAARKIQGLLKSGNRLRDIAVLVRRLENYQPLIAASFKEHGIKYFVDHRRSAAHHPLVCFLRSALHAARFDWNHDSIIALVKTGLAGLSLIDADELENYVLLHRVRGAMWESAEPWPWRRMQPGAQGDPSAELFEDPARMDVLRRRISDGLGPMVRMLRPGKPLPVHDIASEIFATLKRFGIREQLALMNQSVDQNSAVSLDGDDSAEPRDIHKRVWTSLCELFEQMVDLLGEQSVTPADFVDIVESGLERFDLGVTPQTVDQVLVGPADRTRCPPVKSVLVLGLNEGEFPARPRDASVLSDRDRRDLAKRRLELDPDDRRQIFDERLLGYITFSQPSERLVLSRSIGDEKGRVASPSAFWHRVGDLFPEAAIERVSREGADAVSRIATPRQMISGLMRWARTQSEDLEQAGSDDWLSLYQWLAGDGAEHAAVAPLRAAAWQALQYTNHAEKLPSEVAAGLFKSPLSLGAGQLETMAACPFRHFVRYGLKLSARQRADVGGADLGQIYHRLLDRLVANAIADSGQDESNPLAISAAAIHTAAGQAAKALRGEIMLSSARNRYLLRRVERTIADVIAAQQALMKRSRYRPTAAGVSFGQENSRTPALQVRTPAGAEIFVNGRIDRIDALPGGDEAMVVDYRLGANALSLPEVYHGLSLQLLAGLLALEAGSDPLAGRALKPVAAFYLQLLRSYGDVAHPDDAIDPTDERYLLAIKPRGLFDFQALRDLDTALDKGASLVVQAYLKQDGTLGYPHSTDSATSDDFRAILALVKRQMGSLGDEILSGNLAISPYRLARKSPCPNCEFRGICRFETSVNQYHHLQAMGREQVLQNVRMEAANGG